MQELQKEVEHTYIVVLDKVSQQTILNPYLQHEHELSFMTQAIMTSCGFTRDNLVFNSPQLGKLYKKTIKITV